MIRFRLFGFPVTVQWMFWVTCAILGGIDRATTPEGTQALLVWVAVVFISILIHELGHALAMRKFGDPRPEIVLYAFGGLAVPTRWLSRNQDILVSLAGPALQILAGGVVWLLFREHPPKAWLVEVFVGNFIFVSVFWALFNLLPIVPLDGGRVSLAAFGPSRVRIALWISFSLCLACVVFFLARGMTFNGVFFGMLAYNNWQRIRGEGELPWMSAR